MTALTAAHFAKRKGARANVVMRAGDARRGRAAGKGGGGIPSPSMGEG